MISTSTSEPRSLFPKDVVVDNFYLGLVEWPSRGRDYLCVQNRWLARIASERDEWKSARHLRWRISMLNKRIAQKVEAIPGMTLQKVLKEELVVPTRKPDHLMEVAHARL